MTDFIKQWWPHIVVGLVILVLWWLFKDVLMNILRNFLNWLRKKFLRKEAFPKKTVVLITSPHKHESRWSKGADGGKPITFIHIRLSATNITNRPIRLLKAILKKPKHIEGWVWVEHPKQNEADYDLYVSSRHPLLPHKPTKIGVDFTISPPLEEDENKSFKVSFVVVDQYGNESDKIKNLEVYNKLK